RASRQELGTGDRACDGQGFAGDALETDGGIAERELAIEGAARISAESRRRFEKTGRRFYPAARCRTRYWRRISFQHAGGEERRRRERFRRQSQAAGDAVSTVLGRRRCRGQTDHAEPARGRAGHRKSARAQVQVLSARRGVVSLAAGNDAEIVDGARIREGREQAARDTELESAVGEPMWESKKRKAQKRIESLIGAGTVIYGNIAFVGGLRIDGNVKGNVIATDGEPATLVISEHAHVEGDVRVSNIVVNGTVNGQMTIEEHVELQSKARIVGDVSYRSLEMQQGALVHGRLTHNEPGPSSVVEFKRTADDVPLT